MAEMVGSSRSLRTRSNAVGSFFATVWQRLSPRLSGERKMRLRLEEWPDYLLRDIGLDRPARDSGDPRALPTDWLAR